MGENPYLCHVQQNLPRLLALFDRDRVSASYGMGDRYHWAWGLIDFGNGTFQGAPHGLALLRNAGLWPYATSRTAFNRRIDAMFQGAHHLTRQDGSLEEAFPYEGSFCVTAQTAFDLLAALDLLKTDIDEHAMAHWQAIIKPMIGFLINADETHGLISNHLATAVAALVRWQALTGEARASEKAKTLLQRILTNQSEEGWFREYNGADPGYQSLCTYYLADVHKRCPDWNLMNPLRKSIAFLWHFAHPDGSFAGIYGSRGTRFYNPAGMEMLADEIPEANALASFMRQSITQNKVITLSAIDEPNLVPWFNSYCTAAAIYAQRAETSTPTMTVPCLQKVARRMWFPQAGLLVDQGIGHYTIVSTHKGGVTVHFKNDTLVQNDGGIVVRNKYGVLASTQTYSPGNHVQWQDNTLIVQSHLCPLLKRLNGPFAFLALRLLCVSVFRLRSLRECAKGLLVRRLITGRQRWPIKNTRRIQLGPILSIHDDCRLPDGFEQVKHPGPFMAIHMASQGYWQLQDEV